MTRGRAAIVLALGAGWAVAAWLLWRSSLPAYHLPHLDEAALFPPHVLHQARHFSAVERLFWLGKTVTQLVVLGLFARWGVRWTRESAAGPIGAGMLLGMIGFALVWIAELPFAVLAVWWRHRYGLSGSYTDATIGNWFALGAAFLTLCAALAIVMGLARVRWIGDRWWLPAAPVFVGLTTFFAFVAPWLLGGSPFHRQYVTRLERIEHPRPHRRELRRSRAHDHRDDVPAVRRLVLDQPPAPVDSEIHAITGHAELQLSGRAWAVVAAAAGGGDQ